MSQAWFRSHHREGSGSRSEQFWTFSPSSEPQDFVCDDFRNREAIVDLSAIEVGRFQTAHVIGLLRRSGRDRKIRRVFLFQRKIIGGMSEAGEMHCLPPAKA